MAADEPRPASPSAPRGGFEGHERALEPAEIERLFAEIGSDSSLIVWLYEGQGGRLIANRGLCGADPQTDTWRALLHPDDADAFLGGLEASAAVQRSFHAEARFRRADGQWRWLESWARPRFSEAGRFLGMLGTSADVTARKEAQLALDRANQRIAAQTVQLEAVCHAFEDGLVVFDMSGKAVFVNDAEARLFAYDRAAALRLDLAAYAQHFELCSLDGQPLPLEEWPISRVLRGEHVAPPVEVLARRRDTARSWIVAIHGVPVFDERGVQTLAVIITRDATERRRSEETSRVAARGDRLRSELSDAIRPLEDAVEIQREACRVLGRHLGAHRVLYGELAPDGEGVVVSADYAREGRSCVGEYRLDDFGRQAMDELRVGRTLVVSDVEHDPRLEPADRAATARLGTRSYFIVPVEKAGRTVAVLGVHRPTPSVWRTHELGIAAEVAERSWAAVERARSEEALRKSEDRYRTLFNSIDQGFCVFEMIFDERGQAIDYRFLETNPAFERHTGLVDAVGKTAYQLVPDLEPHWAQTYGRVALTGETEHFMLGSDAMGRWFEVAASRVGVPQERKVALVFTDVTARKRADDELRAAHNLIEGITEGTEDLIAAIDLDLRYTYFNQAYAREFERSWGVAIRLGDLVAETFGPWPDQQRRSTELWRRALAGESFRAEVDFGPRPAQERIYELRFSPIRDHRGVVVGASQILRDVTERVGVQQALRESEERLRDSDRRKDEYLAMLGHELRNPLAAMQSATELVRLIEGADPRLDRAVAVLGRQSTHMVRLVDGLLEVSRIARGKVELEKTELEVQRVCEEVLDDRRAQFSAAGLELVEHLPAQPLWVRADRVRLVQILDNLLGNALKFTPAGGRVVLAVARDEDRVGICVRDTGVGIRADKLAQIFEAFHQEDQDVARGRGGLGLGLALAKGLAELHDGSIEARSPGLGQGAEFIVSLPIAAAPLPAANVLSGSEPGARRILVVEDNADAADMLAALLEVQGHAVEAVGDAAEALERLRTAPPPDLVLCDIGLPGMSGYELAQVVRAEPDLRVIPLVALTGYGQPEDRRRTAEAGFDEHLTKPVSLQHLRDVVERYAAVRSRARE